MFLKEIFNSYSLSTKTECYYLSGWIKKNAAYAKIPPKMMNPRDTAVNTEEEEFIFVEVPVLFVQGIRNVHPRHQLQQHRGALHLSHLHHRQQQGERGRHAAPQGDPGDGAGTQQVPPLPHGEWGDTAGTQVPSLPHGEWGDTAGTQVPSLPHGEWSDTAGTQVPSLPHGEWSEGWDTSPILTSW